MISSSSIWQMFTLLSFFGEVAVGQTPGLDSPRVPPGGGAAFAIKSLVFNGSGCPGGVGTEYQLQGDILWIKFPSSMHAETGWDSSESNFRRNCIATLRVNESFQSYALDSVAWYATVGLPEQSTSTLHISWFYEGQKAMGSFESTLTGPASGNWFDNFSQAIPSQKLIWKPCALDRALNINSEIRLPLSPEAEASADLKVVGLRFKKRNCLIPGF